MTRARQNLPSPCTKRTRLVFLPVLSGHVSSEQGQEAARWEAGQGGGDESPPSLGGSAGSTGGGDSGGAARGRCLVTLAGHDASVTCLDAAGAVVPSPTLSQEIRTECLAS